jgi:Uma2 family endonuclease
MTGGSPNHARIARNALTALSTRLGAGPGDPGDKASATRRLPSLRHLVLIRRDQIRVEHYHRDAEGKDFLLTELDRVDALLSLPALGVGIPVAELYARVAFAA